MTGTDDPTPAIVPATARRPVDTRSPAWPARRRIIADRIRDDLTSYGVDLVDDKVRLAMTAVADIAGQRALYHGDPRSRLNAYVGVVAIAASIAERPGELVP